MTVEMTGFSNPMIDFPKSQAQWRASTGTRISILETSMAPCSENIGYYTLQLLIGSIICAVGFWSNSETVVIGSMLVSPIAGAIIDLMRGGRTGTHAGPLKLILAPIICVAVGFLAGLIGSVDTKDEQVSVKARGYSINRNPVLLAGGAIVALAGGAMFISAKIPTSIGLGIATALLPPLVAAGYYCGRMLRGDTINMYTGNDVGFAFSNFACNVVGLLIGAIVVKKLYSPPCMQNFTNPASVAPI